MVRGNTPPEPQPARLSLEQMESAIPKLERRIAELRVLDPSTVQERGDPRFEAVEHKIDDTLVDLFGNNSVEYNRYHVGSLDRAGINFGGTPLFEVQAGYARSIAQAISTLQTIIDLFREKLSDFGETPSGRAKLSQLQLSADRNVFIMMRYRPTTQFSEIESAVRRSLLEFGLVGRLAKDAALVDDLWENIVLYMQYSRYGIAIFEDIEERDFNPNISLELGFMYALKKRCLLLKEKRMPRLPTDICGRIYRNFDCYEIATSLGSEIQNWCKNDLGLQEKRGGVETSEKFGLVVFDNRSDDPEFSSWGSVSSDGLHADHVTLVYPKAASNPEEGVPVMNLSTAGVEYVGLNKAVPFLRGRVRFEYMGVSSSAMNPNLLFCMIPMKGILADLIEVGAQRRSEPANAYSPYRERFFVPEGQIGDGSWHYASLEFDFTRIRDASYSIFAPRINEGCPRPGAGELRIRNVELYVASEDMEGPPNTAVPPDLFRATRFTGR